MENIVAILVLGGILLLRYVARSLSVGKSNEKGPVLGDEFPAIEILQPGETVIVDKVEPVRYAPAAKAVSKSKAQLAESAGRRSTPTVAPQSAKPEEKKEKHGKLVTLNSKSEAKRAFLYSEIFNRKY
jgi:hypothetical protein